MTIFLLLALASGLLVIYLFAAPWLAKHDLFFTFVKEGTAKAIMRGKTFEQFVMSFKGYHLNNPAFKGSDLYRSSYTKDGREIEIRDWQVLYHGRGNPYGFGEKIGEEHVGLPDSHCDIRHSNSWIDRLLKHYGCFWVGMPWNREVYVYEFEWNETYTDRSGKDRIHARDEPTDYIQINDFLYAVRTAEAETRDRIQVDVVTQITVAIRNPYSALFGGEDWMMRVTSEINSHVKAFIGNREYADLIVIQPGHDETIYAAWSREFSEPIIALTDNIPGERPEAERKGLEGRYGVTIRFANFLTFDPSEGTSKEAIAATQQVYRAKQEAEARVVKSESEATAIRNIGEAEANALQARLDTMRRYPDGLALAQLDAIRAASQGAGQQIIWANDPFITAAKVAGRVIVPEERS